MTTEQRQKLDGLWNDVRHAKEKRAAFVKRRKRRIVELDAAHAEESKFYDNEVCNSHIHGTVQAELVSAKYCVLHDTTCILEIRDDYLTAVYSRHVSRTLYKFYEAIVAMFGPDTKLIFSYPIPNHFVCAITVNGENVVFE